MVAKVTFFWYLGLSWYCHQLPSYCMVRVRNIMAADEVSSETKALQPQTRGVPHHRLEDDLFSNISRELDNDVLNSSTLHNPSNGYGASPSGGDDLFGKFPFCSLLFLLISSLSYIWPTAGLVHMLNPYELVRPSLVPFLIGLHIAFASNMAIQFSFFSGKNYLSNIALFCL